MKKRTHHWLTREDCGGAMCARFGAPQLAASLSLPWVFQDAVRGDHGEVASLLIQHGGKVLSKEGELVELADSPLAGNVRIFTDYDPEWEVDPSALHMHEKIGGCGGCVVALLVAGVGRLGWGLAGQRAGRLAHAWPARQLPDSPSAPPAAAPFRRRGRVWHRAQGHVARHHGGRQDPQGDGRRGARRL